MESYNVSLLSLFSFTWHVFKVHPSCIMYQDFNSFLLPSNISLHGYTIFCLFILMSGFYSLHSKQEECCHNGGSKGLGCKRLSSLKSFSLFRIILQGPHREAHAQKRQQFRRTGDQIREALPFLFSMLCSWGFQVERWSCPGIGCFLENATFHWHPTSASQTLFIKSHFPVVQGKQEQQSL